MLNLTGTTHVLRVVTSHAAIVDVMATYVDTDLTTFTPDNNDGVSITTATTTTVVSAPALGWYRNVKGMTIANRHATDSTVVTVQFYDGVTAFVLREQLLPPGVTLVLDDVGNWTVVGKVPRVSQQTVAVAGAGTYTTPVGCKSIFVEIVGGGGGGGGVLDAATNAAGAGGGGAGEYACKMIANPAASYAYSIGAAGAGGAAGANPGTAGGTTSFGGGLFTAVGGSGGLQDTITTIHVGGLGGLGGTGGVAGDLNTPGQAGDFGCALAAAQSKSGSGGSTKFARGGSGLRNTSAAGNAAGAAGGAGGGGAGVISSVGSFAGGNGAAGYLVVTEYY